MNNAKIAPMDTLKKIMQQFSPFTANTVPYFKYFETYTEEINLT